MRLSRTRLLPRETNVRDSRLFIVATEGQHTEKQYFEGFVSRRLRVEVLSTGPDGRSSPKGVLDRLDVFRQQYDLGTDDELWLVVDTDQWPDWQLHEVCGAAEQRGCQLGISNPCFELFLYLHVADADFDHPEFVALVEEARGNRSAAMERWLRLRLADQGGYQKTRVRFERFRHGISDAIRRARALDLAPEERWPTTFPATHVYRLVDRLYPLLSPGPWEPR